MDYSNCIESVTNVIIAISAVTGAITAYLALSSWKEEQSTKRKLELHERILKDLAEIKLSLFEDLGCFAADKDKAQNGRYPRLSDIVKLLNYSKKVNLLYLETRYVSPVVSDELKGIEDNIVRLVMNSSIFKSATKDVAMSINENTKLVDIIESYIEDGLHQYITTLDTGIEKASDTLGKDIAKFYKS